MMAIALRSTYELVDGLLDKGLPFVASYLEKLINRRVIITDNSGIIHYPKIVESANDIEDLSGHSSLYKNNYYYREMDGSLYYPVEYNGTNAFIIIRKLAPHKVLQTISILTEAKLAIKCYFSNLNKVRKTRDKFEKELTEYLLLKTNVDIRHIIKQSEEHLDIEAPYFAVIMNIDKTESKIDWESISSFSREYLKKTNLEIFVLSRPNCLIFIVPAGFNKESSGIGTDWPWIMKRIKYQEAIEDRFNINISQGVGRVYPFLDLRKSFNEAQIALTLSQLMKKRNFIQQFTQLGIYSLVFSRDIGDIKNDCLKTLGPLIQHDDVTGGE
jgi:hypothetical protein